jgi:hypothetical protein
MMHRSVRQTLYLAVTLLAVCLIARNANPQDANQTASQSAKETKRPIVRELRVIEVQPSPAVVGRYASLSFMAWIETYGAMFDSRDLSGLQLYLNHTIVPVQVSVENPEQVIPSSPGEVIAFGNIVFTMVPDALNHSLFGLSSAGDQTASVRDPVTGVRSNFLMFRSVEPLEWWILFLGPFAVFCFIAGCGYLLLWIFYRRMTKLSGKSSSGLLQRPQEVSEKSDLVEPTWQRELAAKAPPEVPQELVNALVDGKAVLVTGSGVAEYAGILSEEKLIAELLHTFRSNLPSSLIAIIDRPDGGEEIRQLLDRPPGLDFFMQALLSSASRQELIAKIAENYESADLDISVFESAAKLPWRAMMALSWDGLLERAAGSKRRGGQGQPWQALSPDQRGEIAAALREHNSRLLLTPLGSIGQPSSVSLSILEFRQALTRAPEFQRGLALMLQTHTFFFLGVRPDALDGFLREITLDYPGTGQRHYTLLPPGGMHPIWETALARFGVAVLSYDDEVRGGFGDFIAALDKDQKEVAHNRGPSHSTTPLSALRVKCLALSNIGPFESLRLDFSTEMPKTAEMPETAELP